MHNFALLLGFATAFESSAELFARLLPTLQRLARISWRIFVGDYKRGPLFDDFAILVLDLDNLRCAAGMREIGGHTEIAIPPKTVAKRAAVLGIAKHGSDQ